MDIDILVVEDDAHIRGMVSKFLSKAGYHVEACANGLAAYELLYSKNYHLVLLDVMLPGMNGYELLQEFRKLHDTPVLMMTALGDDMSQLAAFKNEADDYVVKPFSMPILVRRAEALLRRSGVLKKEVRTGRLTLHLETHEAEYRGGKIQLSPKEFEILLLLVQNRGKIVPHETLLIKIWGYDFEGNEGIIHASMKKLRDKMPPGLIRTVKGVGYRLEVVEHET